MIWAIHTNSKVTLRSNAGCRKVQVNVALPSTNNVMESRSQDFANHLKIATGLGGNSKSGELGIGRTGCQFHCGFIAGSTPPDGSATGALLDMMVIPCKPE